MRRCCLMRLVRAYVALAASTLPIATIAAPVPEFTVTLLGARGQSSAYFFPAAINDRGQVAGGSDALGLSLWQPDSWNSYAGQIHQLGISGMQAYALSSTGVIAGEIHQDAYVWAPTSSNGITGVAVQLSVPHEHSRVVEINANGSIGIEGYPGTDTYRSATATLSPSGVTIDLGLSTFSSRAWIYDINDRDQILGASQSIGNAVWSPNERNDAFSIVEVPGQPSAMNNLGDLVGSIQPVPGSNLSVPAVMYDRGGSYEIQEISGPQGRVGGSASQVNDAGWVAGFVWGRVTSEAFLWSPEFGFVNLGNELGLRLTAVTGMNERGQIIAFDGFSYQGYLLTPTAPIPEPRTAAIFLLGLLAILLFGRLRLGNRRQVGWA